MKILLLFWAAIALSASAFEVSTVIHPAVGKLEPPEFRENLKPAPLAVSSSSPEAAKHVREGMSLLLTAWDFEAYRHFAAAAKLDPDCLMAYWGISMALAGGDHDFQAQQEAAMGRMLDLLENGSGTELEQGYAYAAGKLQAEGLGAGRTAFQAVSEKFPNDTGSKAWAAFLSRTGYDAAGKPRSGHQAPLDALRVLAATHPDDPSLLSFWLFSQAEMPNDEGQLLAEALPSARKLIRLQPDFPPALQLLGHLEWRCGNAALAVTHFHRAAELYAAYMEREKVSLYDCDGWIKAKLYEAAALASKGDTAAARPIFEKLAGLEVPKDRLYSRGASLIMWEARTAGARYQTGVDPASDYDLGLKWLDLLPAEQWHLEHSLAATYQKALGFCLGARKALADGNQAAASAIYKEFLETVRGLMAVKETESRSPSASQYRRALQTLGVLTIELEGLIALQNKGATRAAALTWFRSAAERQPVPSLLMPPPLPDPLELRAAAYLLAEGDAAAAADTCRAALARVPNHLASLQLYLKTLRQLKETEAADRVEKRIALVEQ